MQIGATQWSHEHYVEGAHFSAAVICRQLGFGDSESYETSVEVFGPGAGTVWTSVEFCSGVSDFPCISSVDRMESRWNFSRKDTGVICNGEFHHKFLYFRSKLHLKSSVLW